MLCRKNIKCHRVYLHNSIAYYTKTIWCSLLLVGYKPVQHVTVLNTVGSCNTGIIILWDHRLICGPSLTETSLGGAYLYKIRVCSNVDISWK